MTRVPSFRVGDLVRVIAVSPAVQAQFRWAKDDPASTLRVLSRLLELRVTCQVVEISIDTGWPWIACEELNHIGRLVYHKLVIEPDCIELVSRTSPS
ncbi:MAG: hypothetical protein IPM64_11310 [Phycisphaerales bacterium]|nr:hypothetical protein [Phycisphaerales bacterium]